MIATGDSLREFTFFFFVCLTSQRPTYVMYKYDVMLLIVEVSVFHLRACEVCMNVVVALSMVNKVTKCMQYSTL